MEEKFTCSLCGATYSTAVERAKCELGCDQKRVQAEETKKLKAQLEEKEARWQALIQMRRTLDEMTRRYYEDYPADQYEVFPFLTFWGH